MGKMITGRKNTHWKCLACTDKQPAFNDTINHQTKLLSSSTAWTVRYYRTVIVHNTCLCIEWKEKIKNNNLRNISNVLKNARRFPSSSVLPTLYLLAHILLLFDKESLAGEIYTDTRAQTYKHVHTHTCVWTEHALISHFGRTLFS